jgi:hypothetical protein
MIRKLRSDWVEQQPPLPGRADSRTYWQAFNDRFLSYGGPPIPMVRAAMLGNSSPPL